MKLKIKIKGLGFTISTPKGLKPKGKIKIMGYHIFGKVKTLVLPVPLEGITINEYKDKYGIDLRDFLEISEGYIKLKKGLPNTAVYIDDEGLIFAYNRLNSLKSINVVKHISGTSNGVFDFIYIGDSAGGSSLRIFVSMGDELSLENAIVQANEF